MFCSNKKSDDKSIGLAPFVLFVALIVGLLFTAADFYKMPFKGAGDFAVLALQFCVIEAATLLFVWMISCNKYLFATVFPPLATACAIATYFRYTAGVTLTPMVIDLAMVNDVRTTMDVVTWQLVLFTLLCLAMAVAVVIVRFRRVTVKRPWLNFAVAAVCFTVYMYIPRFAPPIRARIPFVIYFSAKSYIENRNIASENRPAFKGKATCASDTIDVVFILGETLRAQNMQVNGYQRPTTPRLAEDTNAVSLPHIYSEFGITHTSVPYIMTRADSTHYDIAYSERSFIDIFKQAGYRTIWIANQESVETFSYFMNEADTLVYVNSGKSIYTFDQWLDGDIILELDKQMLVQDGSPRRLFVMHTIGSHWWYKSHYPRDYARWSPELNSRVISANTKEEFVNSYNNTVLYSDMFWEEVRNRFRHRNAIVIYLSDHGESLGENGIFCHAEDSEALHYPGCWVWMSDKYRATHADKWKALNYNRKKWYNSAFLFHSILDAGDITTGYINGKYDIFR